MKQNIRFNPNCDNYNDTLEYYKNRAIQLLKFQYRFDKYSRLIINGVEIGAIAYFIALEKTYISFYIYPNYRGNNNYMKAYDKYVRLSYNNLEILTSDDCNLERFLIHKKLSYVIVNLNDNQCYNIISQYYESKKANRSNVYLMNHIDEGYAIMKRLGCSQSAIDAYCLHPIFQANEDLFNLYYKDLFNLYNINPLVLILVMEYRNIAGAYLSHRKINSIEDIELSPIYDVNNMLIADKIQNYKDFEIYHKDTHIRSKELETYFHNWLQRLDISLDQYIRISKNLKIEPILKD